MLCSLIVLDLNIGLCVTLKPIIPSFAFGCMNTLPYLHSNVIAHFSYCRPFTIDRDRLEAIRFPDPGHVGITLSLLTKDLVKKKVVLKLQKIALYLVRVMLNIIGN